MTTPSFTIRSALSSDAQRWAEIYNQGIAERGATFETTLRTTSDFDSKVAAMDRYPVLVAEQAGVVVGWAALSSYRDRACYAGIAEFSIYLDASARKHGIGRALLAALIDAAEGVGFWKLVSRIFTFNTASRALCAACGFREVGEYQKHGRLDGHWLDVVIVERLITQNCGSSQ